MMMWCRMGSTTETKGRWTLYSHQMSLRRAASTQRGAS
eukprot:gene8053-618_t